jgi:diguanylate cyclase (GGDEF)-like protein
MTPTRTRTYLFSVLAITFVVLLAATYAILKSVALRDYQKLERVELQTDLARVRTGLGSVRGDLERVATDYGDRDDTSAFVGRPNPGYIGSNLGDRGLSSLGLNLIAFLGPDGQLVYAKQVDITGKRSVPMSAALEKLLRSGSPALRPGADNAVTSGILALPEGPMLVTAKAILDGQGAGPRKGVLVVGRFLDNSVISTVAHRMAVTLSAARPAAGQPAPEKGESVVRVDGDRSISGSFLLRDVAGAPALLLTVTNDRNLYRRGMDSVGTTMLTLSVSFFVLFLVILLLIEFRVVRPLVRMSGEVERFQAGKRTDADEVVTVPPLHELAILGSEVNKLVSALRRDQAVLAELATKDVLTGVANRRQFLQRGSEEANRISRNAADRDERTLMACIAADIDHFEAMNERHGRDAADAVLREFTERLCQTIRPYDIPARLGGGRFAILLPGTTSEQADAVAGRIRSRITETPFPVGTGTVSVKANFGVAGASGDPLSIDDLLLRAESSLGDAKR